MLPLRNIYPTNLRKHITYEAMSSAKQEETLFVRQYESSAINPSLNKEINTNFFHQLKNKAEVLLLLIQFKYARTNLSRQKQNEILSKLKQCFTNKAGFFGCLHLVKHKNRLCPMGIPTSFKKCVLEFINPKKNPSGLLYLKTHLSPEVFNFIKKAIKVTPSFSSVYEKDTFRNQEPVLVAVTQEKRDLNIEECLKENDCEGIQNFLAQHTFKKEKLTHVFSWACEKVRDKQLQEKAFYILDLLLKHRFLEPNHMKVNNTPVLVWLCQTEFWSANTDEAISLKLMKKLISCELVNTGIRVNGISFLEWAVGQYDSGVVDFDFFVDFIKRSSYETLCQPISYHTGILNWAVSSTTEDNVEFVKLLVDRRVPINKQNLDNQIPLHTAFILLRKAQNQKIKKELSNHFEIISSLLSHPYLSAQDFLIEDSFHRNLICSLQRVKINLSKNNENNENNQIFQSIIEKTEQVWKRLQEEHRQEKRDELDIVFCEAFNRSQSTELTNYTLGCETKDFIKMIEAYEGNGLDAIYSKDVE